MTQENVAASVSIGRGQQALTACEDGTADAGQTEFAVQAAIEDVRNELLAHRPATSASVAF